jgi:hypothetical protein
MAIRAQELEILEPIVRAIAIEMVKLHAQRLPVPLTDPAMLAPVFLYPSLQKTLLQMSAAGLRAIRDEEKLDREFPRPGHHIAASDRLVPGGEIETKLGRTLSDRETGVIHALDLRPVVATRKALIGGLPKPSDVECHRALDTSSLAAICLCESPRSCSERMASRVTPGGRFGPRFRVLIRTDVRIRIGRQRRCLGRCRRRVTD